MFDARVAEALPETARHPPQQQGAATFGSK
jgi:hypothetical protein